MNRLVSRLKQLQFGTLFKQVLFKFVFFRTLIASLNNGFSTTGLELTNLNIELNTLRWLNKKFKKTLVIYVTKLMKNSTPITHFEQQIKIKSGFYGYKASRMRHKLSKIVFPQ